MTKTKVARWRLGVDLGGTKILAVVVDGQGRVRGQARRRTKAKLGYATVVERLVATARDALDHAGIKGFSQLAGIGVGLPGVYDAKRGVVVVAPNLGWIEKPLAKDLRARFRRSAVLGNDVKLGALGELTHGAARGFDEAVMLFMGTGLGGAVVHGGAVVNGNSGIAGEIGHVRAPFDGARCACGRDGCLETVASKRGIARLLKADIKQGRRCLIDDFSELHSSQIKQALMRGCPSTRRALHRAACGLGWGIAAMGTVIDPQVFVLGGGVIEALGKRLMPTVREAVREFSPFYRRRMPDIRLSELGDLAVAVGAAVAALPVARAPRRKARA